jgi:hypothetical protein
MNHHVRKQRTNFDVPAAILGNDGFVGCIHGDLWRQDTRPQHAKESERNVLGIASSGGGTGECVC